MIGGVAFRKGVADGAGLPSLVLMASLVGVGGLARDLGYSAWVGVASTLLIWAGPAQVLLFGSLAAGTALPAVALAVCLSSLRFLPMVASILPYLRGPGIGTFRLLLAAHLVAVTAWNQGMRTLPGLPVAERYPYFIGFGLVVMAAATVATFAGHSLIAELPTFLAAAMLFTTPMFFTASLAERARGAGDWTAILLGFLIAIPLSFLPSNSWLKEFDLLIIGVSAGTIAWFISPRRPAKKPPAKGLVP